MIYLAQPQVGSEEKKALAKVVDSRVLASGREVSEFEALFAAYLGLKPSQAVASSNGTTSLHAALAPLGLKKGDEVLTTPFTFIATSNSVLHAGAKPVFADVDPETWNLSPQAVRKVLDKRGRKVKAILAVHLFGHPADVHALGDLCKKKGLALVEDCAQAHGAAVGERRVGSFGRTASFSFYATKNLPCGEGGMVLAHSEKEAAFIRSFVNHGRGPTGHEVVGYNYRLNNLAAAVGLCQLKKLEKLNQARRRNAALYQRLLRDVPGLTLPVERSGTHHVYHQFTVLAPDRDALSAELRKRGVDSKPFYPRVIPQEPCYKAMGYGRESYPVAENATAHCLSLPVHPGVSEKQVRFIATAIREIMAS
jgi:perosamine synthetase